MASLLKKRGHSGHSGHSRDKHLLLSELRSAIPMTVHLSCLVTAVTLAGCYIGCDRRDYANFSVVTASVTVNLLQTQQLAASVTDVTSVTTKNW